MGASGRLARGEPAATATASTPTTTKQQRELPLSDLDDESADLTELMDSLSAESKTLVKIFKVVISKQFKSELEIMKKELAKKDAEIDFLKSEVKDLKDKIQDLDSHLDSVDQYERRDTIIVSGPTLPQECQAENPLNVIVNTLKNNLKINIKEDDISVAHRLGPITQQRARPMIVKLKNRSLKYDIVGACLKMKPNLFINESLTSKRLNLFKQILAVRGRHRQRFQQCFTKDGRIVVKLRNSTVKHVIVDNKSLNQFLEKYPEMKDTHLDVTSDN